MELLIKAAVIGVTGALAALLIKKSNPELALTLSLAVSLLVLGLALRVFSDLSEIVNMLTRMTGLSNALIAPVLKCMGIGIITRLSSELCREAGQLAVASSVELAGAACALYIALPLIRTLLQMIGELA